MEYIQKNIKHICRQLYFFKFCLVLQCNTHPDGRNVSSIPEVYNKGFHDALYRLVRGSQTKAMCNLLESNMAIKLISGVKCPAGLGREVYSIYLLSWMEAGKIQGYPLSSDLGPSGLLCHCCHVLP